MRKRDAFSDCHPLVNFAYFALVLCFAMLLMHPLSLLISLGGALGYAYRLKGREAMGKSLIFLLPAMGGAAVVNPIFSHEGATILTYLPSGNPLTLESILYGLAAAVMLASVITWFGCYSTVVTSDKFVYLFGRIIPALSLVLSMALRFVPRFQRQLQIILQAQRCQGRDIHSGPMLRRLRTALKVLSIAITWALENAIETADSMKSRGYGLPGRTAFSIYTFDRRDRYLMYWLLGCGLYMFCGWLAGGMAWRYYPTAKGASLQPFPISFQLTYLALCLTPVILTCVEEKKWKSSRSEI